MQETRACPGCYRVLLAGADCPECAAKELMAIAFAAGAAPDVAVPTKQCSKCKRDLPFEAFSKHKGQRLGLSPQCRECKRENAARYRAEEQARREANAEQERMESLRRRPLAAHEVEDWT